jgi:hypothetical protein
VEGAEAGMETVQEVGTSQLIVVNGEWERLGGMDGAGAGCLSRKGES